MIFVCAGQADECAGRVPLRGLAGGLPSARSVVGSSGCPRAPPPSPELQPRVPRPPACGRTWKNASGAGQGAAISQESTRPPTGTAATSPPSSRRSKAAPIRCKNGQLCGNALSDDLRSGRAPGTPCFAASCATSFSRAQSTLPSLELLLEDHPCCSFRKRLHRRPARESLFGTFHFAQSHRSSPTPMGRVVGIISRLLEVNESLCYTGNLRRIYETRIDGRDDRRHRSRGSKGLARRGHLLMREGPRQEQPQSLIGSSRERAGRVSNEQVKEGIISRRHGATKAGLKRGFILPHCELPSLFEQLLGFRCAHAGQWSAE
jgi:hypothetical protein